MLDNRRIIIAEDSEADRFLMTRYLKHFGLSFDCFCNGKDLIDNLHLYPSTIILLDIEMPFLNGMEAARIIKSGKYGEEKKFIILGITSHNDTNKLQEIRQAGFDDYLIKPVSRAALEKKLKNYIQFEIKPSKINYYKSLTENRTGIYSLESLANEDHSFIRSILQIFIDNTPAAIEEMKRAFNEGNFNQLRLVAHKIKPHFTLLKLNNIAEELNELEKLCLSDSEQDNIKRLLTSIDCAALMTVNQIKNDLSKNQLPI